MQVQTALQILETNSLEVDDIFDAYETKVFNERNVFFKDPILPKIIDAKILKLQQYHQALQVLVPNSETKTLIPSIQLEELNLSDWTETLMNYEKNKAAIRQLLANSYQFNVIEKFLLQLKENELQFANMLSLLNLNFENEVKLTDYTPIIEIENELNQLLEQGIIHKSWESIHLANTKLNNFKIAKEAKRLKKLLNE